MQKRGKLIRLKKGAIELDQLGWWIIAVIILVIFLASYFILSGKGISILRHIRNLLSFG
jgi:hypothetical protein